MNGWFRTDSLYDEHPKIIGLSLAARWAHVRLLCYASRYQTGGAIPAAAAAERGTPKILAALETAGLIHRNGDGWTIHDWTDYQPDLAEIERRRAANAERQRRHREADP